MAVAPPILAPPPTSIRDLILRLFQEEHERHPEAQSAELARSVKEAITTLGHAEAGWNEIGHLAVLSLVSFTQLAERGVIRRQRLQTAEPYDPGPNGRKLWIWSEWDYRIDTPSGLRRIADCTAEDIAYHIARLRSGIEAYARELGRYERLHSALPAGKTVREAFTEEEFLAIWDS
jgi:hypothetical protein